MKLGTNADIQEAISLNRSALELRPMGHPDRYLVLIHRPCKCIEFKRYDQQDSIADLEEATTLGRASLDLPLGLADRALALENLGGYLRKRFMKLGGDADIDEAISWHRSAFDLRPTGHPMRQPSQ